MKKISYTITDELGIHARPAGQLVKAAAAFSCDIKITANGKTVDAKRIMGVMGLAAKKGMSITVSFDGPGEETAMKTIETFLKENL